MAFCCILVLFQFLFMYYKSLKKYKSLITFWFLSFTTRSARIEKRIIFSLCEVYICRLCGALHTNIRVHLIPLTQLQEMQTKHPVTFKCIEFRVGPLLHSEWKALQHGHCTAHFHALVLHNAGSFHQMIGPS